MLAIVLVLELAVLEGEDGFNLTQAVSYSGLSRYKLRSLMKELQKLKLMKRKANRFFPTLRCSEVYNSLLGGQKPMDLKSEEISNEEGCPF